MQAIILDQKLKILVASERKITHEILLVIQTLDISKSFRELGYSSLFEYLVKEIGYSEGSAQRRISSARLMKQVPQIANDLKLGNLNLTQVSLAQVAIRQEEKAQSQKISVTKKTELLQKLKSKSTFETQKILKESLPAFEIPKPKAIPAGDGKVHVTLQFSDKDWEKVQSLLAHFSHMIPDQKLESLLLHWQEQVEKKKQKQFEKTETKKAQNQEVSTTQKSLSAMESSEQKMRSTDILPPLRQWKNRNAQWWKMNSRCYIPSGIKAQVRNQAHEQCEFVSQETGRRCESKHFLETEHRIPIAKGGSSEVHNLRLFCRSHNALAAKIEGIADTGYTN